MQMNRETLSLEVARLTDADYGEADIWEWRLRIAKELQGLLDEFTEAEARLTELVNWSDAAYFKLPTTKRFNRPVIDRAKYYIAHLHDTSAIPSI
jgi:hypothetical protein